MWPLTSKHETNAMATTDCSLLRIQSKAGDGCYQQAHALGLAGDACRLL